MTFRLLAAFALVHLVFAIWPGIDLWISGLFTEGGRFPLVQNAEMEWLRQAIWTVAIAICVGAMALAPIWLVAGPGRQVPARLWAWAAGVFLLGPGLVVNGLLKAHWGRARPADVFRGDATFSPPFQMVDQCTRNCSFVSGEAAGATALAVVVGVLLWPQLGRRGRWAAALALASVAAVAAGMRVMTGRHFVSDVLFSGFVVAFVALGLWRLLRLGPVLHAASPAALRHDLGLMRVRLATAWRRLAG